MFFSTGISGSDLPDKTLCFTFDDGPGATEGDGPGPRSLELSRFLYDRGIPGTFFVIGTFAEHRLDALEQMSRMGHLIANHTLTHAAIAGKTGWEAAQEIMEADRVIAGIQRPLKLFRPPYGKWDAEVAGQLNWTEARRHIGPVLWDIDGRDWKHWRDSRSVQECAAAYIRMVQEAGNGIVLMHDNLFEEEIRGRSRTFQVLKILVDWLEQNGYTFIRLDSIPQIVHASRIGSVIALQTADGHYLSPQQGGGSQVLADGASVGAWEPLGVVELGGGNIALRCLSGHYLSFQKDSGEIWANSTAIGGREILERLDLGDGKIAIRCSNGCYLSAQNGGGGMVLANGTTVTDREMLRVVVPQ